MEIPDLNLVKQGEQVEYITDKEAVLLLVEKVFEALSTETGANALMLKPVLNIAKLKLSDLDDETAAKIVDQVHLVSRTLEQKTGKFSNYHGAV